MKDLVYNNYGDLGRPRKYSYQQIIRLYNKGCTRKEIKEQCKCSYTLVCDVIKKYEKGAFKIV